MRSPASRRPTSSFTMRSWIVGCWRSRDRRRDSNSRASAAADRPPIRTTYPSAWLSLRGLDIGCCGSRAAILACSGVAAGLAGLTAAAIPATFRGMNRALILAAGYGADDDGLDWTALARTGQPIVLYMAMRNLAAIADQLMRGGLPPSTPAAIVVSATMADERIVVSTLDRVAADAQEHQLGTPSIIVI